MGEIKEFGDSEEKTIESILSTIKIPEIIDKKNRSEFVLQYGDKAVTIFFLPRINTFKTFLENIENTTKINGATTLLYKAAKQLMVDISRKLKQETNYFEETTYPNVGEWLKTKANDIFHWTDITEKKENDEYSLTCRATISNS